MKKNFRPGQRVIADVDGVRMRVVFSLETEEKGDDRQYCWRYDAPYFPVVPKELKVDPVSSDGIEPRPMASKRYTESLAWSHEWEYE